MQKNYDIFVFGGRSKANALQGQRCKKIVIFQSQGISGSSPVCLYSYCRQNIWRNPRSAHQGRTCRRVLLYFFFHPDSFCIVLSVCGFWSELAVKIACRGAAVTNSSFPCCNRGSSSALPPSAQTTLPFWGHSARRTRSYPDPGGRLPPSPPQRG